MDREMFGINKKTITDKSYYISRKALIDQIKHNYNGKVTLGELTEKRYNIFDTIQYSIYNIEYEGMISKIIDSKIGILPGKITKWTKKAINFNRLYPSLNFEDMVIIDNDTRVIVKCNKHGTITECLINTIRNECIDCHSGVLPVRNERYIFPGNPSHKNIKEDPEKYWFMLIPGNIQYDYEFDFLDENYKTVSGYDDENKKVYDFYHHKQDHIPSFLKLRKNIFEKQGFSYYCINKSEWNRCLRCSSKMEKLEKSYHK